MGPPPVFSQDPSATPTGVSTAPSPSISTVHQTEIPASTVIGIGLGFVALTTCMLCSLIAYRVLRVYQTVWYRRRHGEPDVRFKEEWRRAGGMFGFMSGFNNNGPGDSALIVGAGGVEMRRRMELAMLRERLRAMNAPEMVEPVLWDHWIGTDEKGDAVEQVDDWGILALDSHASQHCKSEYGHTWNSPLPLLTVSILIAMPSPESDPAKAPPAHSDGTDDGADTWELPDVMIGLADVAPVVDIRGAGNVRTGNQENDQKRQREGRKKSDVEHVEYVGMADPAGTGNETGITRRAEWKRDRRGHLYIEGLSGLYES